ncbi:MAG: MBOAT family protein [Lachnospiraceae bacterium]|nr:MBOAT family protein [Lachnospiraceae bacterium]
MVFSSIPFLYYFLPCVLLAYFLMPAKGRNGVLLVASLAFYAWGEPVYILLMLFSILVGYVSGILLEQSMERKWKAITPKAVLSGSIVIFTGLFIYFKYTDFFIRSFNAVTGTEIPLLHIVLPIGISFYTFQIISYLVDIYRRETKAQRNIISLATYIAMFPQLIAGPIVRYTDISGQLENRKSTVAMLESGICRFIIGLSKKVLLANELGALCEIFRASGDKSVLYYWMYAAAFTLHIYFDFSGYSDMAIGLGRILGFSFPENFNYPYISGSITEFWRRWHMSLGTWFRDYLYIPLGGNRVSQVKWIRNIFIVWMFTGLWHGASWNFVLWGLFFGVILMIEKRWLLKILDKTKVIKHLYVIFLLLISFIIFNASNMKEAWLDIRCMFGMGGIPVVSGEALYYLKSYGVTFLVSMIGCLPVAKKFAGRWQILKIAGVLLLLILSTAYLVDGSFNPFLYFRF